MSAAGLSLETATRRGCFFSWVGGFEAAVVVVVAVTVPMREVTAAKLDRRVVVRAGEGGVTVMASGMLISGSWTASLVALGESGVVSRSLGEDQSADEPKTSLPQEYTPSLGGSRRHAT